MTNHTTAENLRVDQLAAQLGQLDEQSLTPLYAQLRECLQAWIATCEPGDRLPAERWLAEQAGVNRGTLRKALTELETLGLLERGARGTVIARRRPLPLPSAPHPLMRVLPSTPRQLQTVRLAVYENLPHQRRFWQDVCSTLTDTDARLELDWVPETVTTANGYAEFVADRGCHLAVFSGGMEHALRSRGLLQPLPQSLCEAVGSDELWWRHLTQVHDPLLPWGVPVHVAIPLFVWNRELLPRAPEPAPWLTFEQLAAWLDTAQQDCAASVSLLGSPFSVLDVLGAVCHPMREAEVRARLRCLFAQLARLNTYSAVTQSRHLEMFETGRLFLTEQSATYFGPTTTVFSAPAAELAHLRCALVQPTAGHLVAVNESAVGLTGLGQPGEAASQVLRALTGPAVQALVAQHRLNLPVRRQQADAFAAQLGVGAASLAALLAHCRLLPAEGHAWDWYVQHSLITLPQVRQLAGPRDDLDEAGYQAALAIARNHFHFLIDGAE